MKIEMTKSELSFLIGIEVEKYKKEFEKLFYNNILNIDKPHSIELDYKFIKESRFGKKEVERR